MKHRARGLTPTEWKAVETYFKSRPTWFGLDSDRDEIANILYDHAYGLRLEMGHGQAIIVLDFDGFHPPLFVLALRADGLLTEILVAHDEVSATLLKRQRDPSPREFVRR